MDKFFLALIGVFLGIFAYLKIQLSFSKRKAQKALSESAKTNAEKESIENYASVMDALSKRLESIKDLDPNKRLEEVKDLEPIKRLDEAKDLGSIKDIDSNKDLNPNIDPNIKATSNDHSAEAPRPLDTPLDSGASALNDTVQSLSHEQLIRLRQLKGL